MEPSFAASLFVKKAFQAQKLCKNAALRWRGSYFPILKLTPACMLPTNVRVENGVGA
jgi:hypothetical protein